MSWILLTTRQQVRKASIFLIGLIIVFIVAACGTGNNVGMGTSKREIPFSDAEWDDSLSDIIELYGDYSDKYDSNYGGPCYVYEGTEYEGINGNTRYFFDENNALVCVEFYANFDTADELELAYEEEKERLTSAYGNSGYQINESGIIGENWYREEGNIGILAVPFLSRNEFQIKYLSATISIDSPEMSNGEKDVDEMSEYLEKYVELVDYKVEECEGYRGTMPGLHEVSIRNNGNMEIGNVRVNLQFYSPLGEIIDSKEVTVLGLLDGTIKPGYSWKMEDDKFFELDELNDGVELNRVKVSISYAELSEAKIDTLKTDEEIYIDEYLELTDYEVGMCSSYHGEVPGLSKVSLKNSGEHDLDSVTVTVYFQDEDNKNIAEASFMVIGNIWSADELKANYSWAMEDDKFYEIKNLADEVDISRYSVKITDIEFS